MASQSSSRCTVVSAPGKVLMAGGYLVLDREYSGLVISTSSRFYCVVSSLSESSASFGPSGSSGSSGSARADETKANGESSRHPSARIQVRAGQFPSTSSTWTYELSLRTSLSGSVASGRTKLEADLVLRQVGSEGGRNKFVEITLVKALELAWEVIDRDMERPNTATSSARELIERIRGSGEGVELVVLADNDFYSQREQLSAANLPRTLSSLASLPPFSPLPRPLHQTNKTGLGSSAALVTSLTAGLLQHLDVVDIPSPGASEALHQSSTWDQPSESAPTASTTSASPNAAESKTQALDLIHNLAQLSHCSAQGKVGSGFDISSAVYGTHQYKRFSPSVLAPLLASSSSSGTQFETLLDSSRRLLPALNSPEWDHRTRPFRLPAGLRLMLADVDAGTDTPSFIGKVLQWREKNKEIADELWRKLGETNDNLGAELRRLSEMEGEEGYREALSSAARVEGIVKMPEQHSAVDALQSIHVQLDAIREYMRHMSELSDVPIEPPKQTRLLDACCVLPGVIGGGVPGAGGYDALFLLVIDDPQVINSVEQVWSSWTEMSVCPLSARQSDGGLRREEEDGVPGLLEALQRP